MTDHADLRRLAEQAKEQGWWPTLPDPQAILDLLDERDEYEAKLGHQIGVPCAAERRVAALEEGLRRLITATNEIVWCVVCNEEAQSLAEEARALLDPVEADYQRFLHPDPAALPAERLRLGQQVAIRSHLPGDLDAMADQISEATDE